MKMVPKITERMRTIPSAIKKTIIKPKKAVCKRSKRPISPKFFFINFFPFGLLDFFERFFTQQT